MVGAETTVGGVRSNQTVPHFSAAYSGSNGLPPLDLVGISTFPNAKPFLPEYQLRHPLSTLTVLSVAELPGFYPCNV